ncbi:hypothetical protein NK553_10005 [Pseudomonas sp. ZM23]|uniref:Lipoprotein n=1 Tax=Pseudomonas triclosanedens TaxID=2961893 RepID=A0ABY7A2X6_9PSED|nr:hypothetical protein [Pseudomonas triclosanedens]MCP8464280.1 hypothetical protein [Pseudomonas triclosanedens]MCP8471414.1 hypothetical protein [Pseudomonas triclosanedens]MCP8477777.1 hypothetical protein [Pseudomonas triclosanedens]WAI51232.1 hypothetical protein OU419_08215 [Pseudomonas triclosanedens]
MKYLVPVLALLALGGCITMTGNYEVTAKDESGNALSKGKFLAHGSGIYTVRNSICSVYPKAVVTIRDVETNEELAGESPYRCD